MKTNSAWTISLAQTRLFNDAVMTFGARRGLSLSIEGRVGGTEPLCHCPHPFLRIPLPRRESAEEPEGVFYEYAAGQHSYEG